MGYLALLLALQLADASTSGYCTQQGAWSVCYPNGGEVGGTIVVPKIEDKEKANERFQAAVHALNGVLSSRFVDPDNFARNADLAVKNADALLKELEK